MDGNNCLLMLKSRLTVHTIATSCLLNSCCLPFVRFLANSSFFSRRVPWHTGHVTLSISLDVTHLHSSHQICGGRIAQTLILSTTRSAQMSAWQGSAVPRRLLHTGHRCCRQAASQVSHTATDGGSTTSAIHCWTLSFRCARSHGLELPAG